MSAGAESLRLHGPAGRWLLHATAVVIFLFMYVPMVMLVLFSFNGSPLLLFPLANLSFRWYAALYADHELQVSIWNSVVVVAAVVPLTLALGVPLAISLQRYRIPGAGLIEKLTMIPLIVPGLITGLAILLVVKRVGLPLSLGTVVLGHTVGWLPVVVSQVHARLRRIDRRLEEASLDLGATPWQTFWRITLPGIRTAILGSALLVTTLSLNEVAITFFLTGQDNTMPMQIWAMLRHGITPEVNAIATLSMVLSVAAVVVALRILRTREDERPAA
jgi:spermidine/putrescine transport system permease protein